MAGAAMGVGSEEMRNVLSSQLGTPGYKGLERE